MACTFSKRNDIDFHLKANQKISLFSLQSTDPNLGAPHFDFPGTEIES